MGGGSRWTASAITASLIFPTMSAVTASHSAGGIDPRAATSWWLRDDTGQWHVAVVTAEGENYRQLLVVPPVTPGSTALDLVVTGQAARPGVDLGVRVAVGYRSATEPCGQAVHLPQPAAGRIQELPRAVQLVTRGTTAPPPTPGE